MSFLDNLTQQQQACLIELVRQRFPDNSLHQQPARPVLQEENIASRTRRSIENGDDDGECSQYYCSDEESEKEDEDKYIQVCFL
jgi:hypothetical protein